MSANTRHVSLFYSLRRRREEGGVWRTIKLLMILSWSGSQLLLRRPGSRLCGGCWWRVVALLPRLEERQDEQSARPADADGQGGVGGGLARGGCPQWPAQARAFCQEEEMETRQETQLQEYDLLHSSEGTDLEVEEELSEFQHLTTTSSLPAGSFTATSSPSPCHQR